MNFFTNYNYNYNSFASTKGSFLAKREETKNNEKTNNSAPAPETEKPSYADIIRNQPVVTTPKEDLYNAYWTMYQKDLEQSNVGLGSNEFGNKSRLSVENSKKIITNEDEAKEHLDSFLTKLIDELKNQGKYDKNMEESFQFVRENFRWDKYFELYPSANANKLELIYMQALASATSGNEIASKFIVDDLPHNI